ncbi:MAG: 2-(1,2-epoxy-1,2-dihydrophenyl)acetyl-CoA isomerase [Amylibacter sp.]|nr:2-(1,2-epoxy-1,2-dihydrophenyl)acetyl-CoA isomerase [Amylibacter sp.]
MSDTIITVKNNNWMEITLNRPDRLNSFTDEMHAALHASLTDAANNPDIRAVLLTGSGRGFCAGQDLQGRDPRKMSGPPDLAHTLETLYNPLVRLIRGMEKPVICAVNGVAAGAGANIALACDIVLASGAAKFIQSFANVGLVPDAGGSWSLTHLVGPARAKGLALTGQPITAATAQEWGLIWKVVANDDLIEEARALTTKLADGPTVGLALTKQAIHAAGANSFDEQLQLEAKLQQVCGRTADYKEGVSAFLEKRAPKFTGRK